MAELSVHLAQCEGLVARSRARSRARVHCSSCGSFSGTPDQVGAHRGSCRKSTTPAVKRRLSAPQLGKCDKCELKFHSSRLAQHSAACQIDLSSCVRCEKCFKVNQKTGQRVKCYFNDDAALGKHNSAKHRANALRSRPGVSQNEGD